MDNYLLWFLLGFGLLIVELLTGTFFLLMFGIAAFAAGAIAFFGGSFPVQIITAAVAAGIGSYFVHLYRVRNAQEQMPSMDAGQAVRFEAWVDEGARVARVQYRGAPWEARVDGDAQVQPNAMLYILNVNGNTLTVTHTRPQ